MCKEDGKKITGPTDPDFPFLFLFFFFYFFFSWLKSCEISRLFWQKCENCLEMFETKSVYFSECFLQKTSDFIRFFFFTHQ